MNRLTFIAAELVSILGPVVGDGPKRANLTNAILTALRPYVEQTVTGVAPKVLRDVAIQREKRWLISLEFWSGEGLTECVGASHGRARANNKVVTYGGDIVQGLDAAAALIEDFARQIGAPLAAGAFNYADVSRALNYLRPTISRRHGHATMRRTTPDKAWHLICDVFRDDAFPKE